MYTIVHVIDNMARSGAETLLIDLLPALGKHYRIILVTLNDRNDFDETIYQRCYKHYCLHHKGRFYVPRTVNRLRKIIEKHQPVLVRSQLIWSTIIAKLACPKKIPLVFSVHITMEVFHETILGTALALLEKLTLSKRYTMIGVTKEVVADYVRKFRSKGKTFVLYNYVKSDFFIDKPTYRTGNTLRLLAVGKLRAPKNYQYLIEDFKGLKGENVSLDIYGGGDLRTSLQAQIDEHSLAINLKGRSGNIPELMKQYDGFVMVSAFEGFGIAAAEAMAAGLPLILSPLPVLKEVTENQAFFVDLSNPETFVDLVRSFLYKQTDINMHVVINKKAALEKYTQEVYLKKLLDIYEKAIVANQYKMKSVNNDTINQLG